MTELAMVEDAMAALTTASSPSQTCRYSGTMAGSCPHAWSPSTASRSPRSWRRTGDQAPVAGGILSLMRTQRYV
jgi:hypothetical protein